MFDHPAFPIVFFLVAGFGFGIAVLYALARAWERTLDPRRNFVTRINGQESNRKPIEPSSMTRRHTDKPPP